MIQKDIELLTNDELNRLTYDEFIQDRFVYDTYKDAQAKGYEAHHINPVCTQNGLERTDSKVDQHCVRLTPFEHIVAHYLLAKERQTFGLLSCFFCMINQNKWKLTDLDKIKTELWNKHIDKTTDKKEFFDKEEDIFLYEIVCPDGHKEKISNLSKWLRDNNLNNTYFNKLLNGKTIDGYSFIRIYDKTKNGGLTWEITYPDGSIEEISNLSNWCKNCGYFEHPVKAAQKLSSTSSHHRYKGFKAKKIY